MEWTHVNSFDVKTNRYILYDDGSIYDTKKEKFKTTHIDKDGYHYISLSTNSSGHKKFRLNRVNCQTWFPINNPKLYEANHINGNIDDNSKSNLEWLTPSDNIQHSIHVLCNDRIGINHPSNIYNEKLIHEICKSLEKGIFRYKNIIIDIENRTGNYMIVVDKESFSNLIMMIRNHKRWTHISSQYNIPKLSEIEKYGITHDPENIHKICKLIHTTCLSNKEIAILVFGKYTRKYSDFIYKIRYKKTYKEYSDLYW